MHLTARIVPMHSKLKALKNHPDGMPSHFIPANSSQNVIESSSMKLIYDRKGKRIVHLIQGVFVRTNIANDVLFMFKTM